MAYTYTKPLKTIVITTIGGTEFTVADTATASIASNALAQFLHGGIMNFPSDGGTVYVPFHAVDHIVVTTEQSSDIDKADPYCQSDDDDLAH